MMVRVELPYATFGLVVEGDRIRRAPPIARWTIGLKVEVVIAQYRRDGAKVEVV